MPFSLRVRLTVAVMVVTLFGAAGAAFLLVARLQASLLANLVNAATQQTQSLAAEAAHSRLPAVLPTSNETAAVIQVVDENGLVISSSANILGRKALFSFPTAGSDPSTSAVSDVRVGDDSTPYRVAGLAATGPNGKLTVYVALPTNEIEQSVDELTYVLGLGVPLAAIALTGLGWLLIGRALRPVEQMRLQAAAISGTDLHRRLASSTSNDELGRLAETFNDLLARIESTAGQQVRFVGDAAHELRSPLAIIQTQLEVALAHPEAIDCTALLPDLLTDTRRLARLVSDLLMLARLDAHRPARLETVDLDDLLLLQAQRARGRGCAVDTRAVSAGRVRADPDALDSAFRNLVDNALRHADSVVHIGLTASPGRVQAFVADDGVGIRPEDRELVFQRFTRLDSARSRDAGGSGLGLAIVRDVITTAGGHVRIEDNQPGARFVVDLPSERL